MLRTLTQWLRRKVFRTPIVTRQRRARSAGLRVEVLEDRTCPIIGSSFIPATVLPGGDYDGVVKLSAGMPMGSGSLIAPGDGHYILTVAHNNETLADGSTKPGSITFNLARDGTPVDVVIPLPQNRPAGGAAPPAATATVINNTNSIFFGENDISLWKLVDPSNPQPDQLLVAPYTAQQYTPYVQQVPMSTNPSPLVNQQVTVAGYGMTGVGTTGSTTTSSFFGAGIKRAGNNIIDSLGTVLGNQIELIQAPDAGAFRVGWRGVWANAVLTRNSTQNDVLTALNSLAPLNGNVTVQTVTGLPGMWWVTFVNNLGAQAIDVNNLMVGNPITAISENAGLGTVSVTLAGRSNLSNGQQVAISNVSTFAIADASEGGVNGTTVTINTKTPHNFANGDTVTITGFAGPDAGYNAPGGVVIANVGPSTFTYTAVGNVANLPASNPTNAQAAGAGAAFNGSFTVAVANPANNTFTFTRANAATPAVNAPTGGTMTPLAGTAVAITGAAQGGTTVEFDTAVPTGFITGQQVFINGVGPGYNGLFTVTSTSPQGFRCSNPITGLPGLGTAIGAAALAGATATPTAGSWVSVVRTTGPTGGGSGLAQSTLSNNRTLLMDFDNGAAINNANGVLYGSTSGTITSAPGQQTITINNAAAQSAGIFSATEAGTTVEIITNADNPFVTGQVVVISGFTGAAAGYNAPDGVEITVTAANRFTYTVVGNVQNLPDTNPVAATAVGSTFRLVYRPVSTPVRILSASTEVIPFGLSFITVATVTTAGPHNFSAGQPVVVSEFLNNPGYNGTFPILSTPAPNTFTYLSPFGSLPNDAAGGQNSPRAFQPGANPVNAQFTAPIPANATAADVLNALQTLPALAPSRPPSPLSTIAQISEMGNLVVVTTAAPHNLRPGQPVQIAGVSNAGYNGQFQVLSAFPTLFTFTNPNAAGLPTLAGGAVPAGGVAAATATLASTAITDARQNLTTVTITTSAPHGFVSGQTVTIAGFAGGAAGYNSPAGGVRVTVTGVRTFTYTAGAGLPAQANPVGATAVFSGFGASASQINNEVTIVTAAPHNFIVGQTVVISGFAAPNAAYNGQFVITQVQPGSFKYINPVAGLGNAANGSATSGTLANPGAPTISVSGPAGGPWVVTFLNSTGVNNLGGSAVNPLMFANSANVIGATNLVNPGGAAPQAGVQVGAQGIQEVGSASGDSGGPYLIGGNTIVGLTEGRVLSGSPPLFTPVLRDAVFGDTMLGINVAAYSQPGGPITNAMVDLLGFATITTAAASSFSYGQQVVVSGVTNSGYNGTFTVLGSSGNNLTYWVGNPLLPNSNGGTAVGWIQGQINANVNSTTKYGLVLDMSYQAAGQNRPASTVTNQGVGLPSVLPLDPLTITASSDPAGAMLLQVNDPNSARLTGPYFSGPSNTINALTIRGAANPNSIVVNGDLGVPATLNGSAPSVPIRFADQLGGGNDVRVITTIPHNFQPGQQVQISGVSNNAGLVAGYNGSFTITNCPNPFQFTYANPAGGLPPAEVGTAALLGNGIATATQGANNLVTITTAGSHDFQTGQAVRIAGVATGYNGTFVVTRLSDTQFTYTANSGPLANQNAGGSAARAGAAITGASKAGNVVTITAPGHNLVPQQWVTIAGAANAGYNGVFQVQTVAANSFTYNTTPGALPAVGAGGLAISTNRLVINAPANSTYTVTATTITRTGGSVINYSNFQQVLIVTGAGNNFVNILATDPNCQVSVSAAGNTRVNVGGTALGNWLNGGTLDNIAGAVSVTGNPGATTTLNLFDRASAGGQTYTVTGASITRSGGVGTISYGGLTQLNVNTAVAGGNTVNIRGTSAPTRVNSSGPNNNINVTRNRTVTDIVAPLFVTGGGAANNRLHVDALMNPVGGVSLVGAPQSWTNWFTTPFSSISIGGSAPISYRNTSLSYTPPDSVPLPPNLASIQTPGPLDQTADTTIITGTQGDTVRFDVTQTIGTAHFTIDDSAGLATAQFNTGTIDSTQVAFVADTNVSVTGGTFDVISDVDAVAALVSAGSLTIAPAQTLTASGNADLTGGTTNVSGAFDVAGNFTQGPNNTLSLDVAYPAAPITVSGLISVHGLLNINSITGYSTSPGTIITLIQNLEPNGAIPDGPFIGLPDGAPIVVDNTTYNISYHGGVSLRDVVLTLVSGPPPAGIPVANYFTVPAPFGQTTLIDLAAHGSSGTGDPVTAAAVVAQPANGAVVPAGTVFAFTPAPLNFSGPTFLTYNVSYNGLTSNTETVAVMVSAGTPVIHLSSNGGTYDGTGFAASATIAGVISDVDDTPGPGLENVPLVVSYYNGSQAAGMAFTDAPTQAGTYTAVAQFAGSANYAGASAMATFTITPAQLSVNAIGQDKTYDATTEATATLNVTGVVGTDDVAAGYASAAFSDANAGAAKTVTVNGITLSGTSAGNYTVADTATTVAGIMPAQLVVTATGQSKVYDSTTAATTTLSLSGIFGSDVVAASYAIASFSDASAGAGKAVSVTGITLSGTSAANYTAADSAAASADITPVQLGLTAVGQNKVYDGTPNATATLVLAGALGADAVAASYVDAFFDDAEVGVGKTVTVSGITLSGADAGNYAVADTASTSADITPAAPIVITVSNLANGQSVDLPYSVNGTAAGPVAAMAYQIDDGPVTSITVAPDGSFSIPLTSTNTTSGPHTLTVYAYGSDNSTTTTALTFSANASPPADPIVITVSNLANGQTVNLPYSVNGTTTGAVQSMSFQIDDGAVISVTIAPDGSFSIPLTDSNVPVSGPHMLTILAFGSSNSTTLAITFTVAAPPANPQSTSISLAISDATPGDQTFSLDATVTNQTSAFKPGGTVQFWDGAALLGTGFVDAFGKCSILVSTDWSFGSHSVFAIYSGDANFTGSSSAGTTPTITEGPSTVQTGSGPALLLGNGKRLRVDPATGDLIIEIVAV